MAVNTPDVAQAQRYIARAVAPSTAITYQSAYRQYCKHFEGRRDDPHGRITLAHAMNWLAALGAGGQHTASTIGIYRFALASTFAQTSEALTTTNPLSHRQSRCCCAASATRINGATRRSASTRRARQR
jgi:hypothetical protein